MLMGVVVVELVFVMVEEELAEGMFQKMVRSSDKVEKREWVTAVGLM